MKLIIQIPCRDEALTLAGVVAELPRTLPGITQIETLVIDDGSTDGTAELARRIGVDHVLVLPAVGLARAFAAGLRECLARGADLIVNLDGDHQYRAADLPALIAPILDRSADVVIGVRPIAEHPNFGARKKWLQNLGSRVVSLLTATSIADVTSGFRALSRPAAEALRIDNNFTYTLEMIARLANDFRIATVPVGVNAVSRPSRLVRSDLVYCVRQTRILVATLAKIRLAPRSARQRTDQRTRR